MAIQPLLLVLLAFTAGSRSEDGQSGRLRDVLNRPWQARAMSELAVPVAAPPHKLQPVPPTYWTGQCTRASCYARHPGIKVVPERTNRWRL